MTSGSSVPRVAPIEPAEPVTRDMEVITELLSRIYAEHPATLGRAVAFIDEHAHEDITIADIAAAFVSIRGLQLAFRRHLDSTPLAYLRRVRLAHAHRQLRVADPARETVTAVAYRWGFSNPTRFTAYYRRAYGTVPSHTLYK